MNSKLAKEEWIFFFSEACRTVLFQTFLRVSNTILILEDITRQLRDYYNTMG